jgi:hypothetical protein
MMQVIDDAYVGALLDLPDGRERVTRWIFDLLNQRDDAQIIAKALIEKLKGSVDFLEIEGSAEEAAQLLAWFSTRTDLDLAYKYDLEPRDIPKALMKPGPLPEQGWTVHKSHGGVNDREWDMVALEATAIEALRTAHRAFCDGR